jgi:hypothetical protein
MKKSRKNLSGFHFLLVSVNVHTFFTAGDMFEFNGAVCGSVKRVVRTAADVAAGMDVGAALSDNYIAGKHVRSVALFDAEPLSAAVTSVLGRTDAFFMCEKLQTEL